MVLFPASVPTGSPEQLRLIFAYGFSSEFRFIHYSLSPLKRCISWQLQLCNIGSRIGTA